MTKKHFIALADHIRMQMNAPGYEFNVAQISHLADFCLSQNRNFNRDRWIDYINGKCGPNGGAR